MRVRQRYASETQLGSSFHHTSRTQKEGAGRGEFDTGARSIYICTQSEPDAFGSDPTRGTGPPHGMCARGSPFLFSALSNMTVLTVCNHKGGTGKTTSVIHIAAALGLSGQQVLVFDLDPQGFLTSTLDVNEPPPEESIAAFFDPDLDPGQIRLHEASGFDLVPSSSTLTRRMRRLNKPTDVLWVREALGELSLDYDLVVFDTAAAVTVYSLNALVACDHVLIPVLPEYQAVIGAEQTFQTAGMVHKKLNPAMQSRLMLFTQVDGRKRVHQTYREYIRGKYGASHVMDTEIRTSTSLTQAHDEGETVFDHDPNARGARDYANAVDELWTRMHSDAGPDEASESVKSDQTPPEPGSSPSDGDGTDSYAPSPPVSSR